MKQPLSAPKDREKGVAQILPLIMLALFAVTTFVISNRIETNLQKLKTLKTRSSTAPTPSPTSSFAKELIETDPETTTPTEGIKAQPLVLTDVPVTLPSELSFKVSPVTAGGVGKGYVVVAPLRLDNLVASKKAEIGQPIESLIESDPKAVVSANANFFNFEGGTTLPVGPFGAGGEVTIYDLGTSGLEFWSLVGDKNGAFSVVKSAEVKESENLHFAVTGYPLLIKDSKAQEIPDKPWLIDRTAARTAIGINREIGQLFIISTPGSTARELQAALLDLGAKDAINLDGGPSSGLAIRNQDKVETKVGSENYQVAASIGVVYGQLVEIIGPEVATNTGFALLIIEAPPPFSGYCPGNADFSPDYVPPLTDYSSIKVHPRVVFKLNAFIQAAQAEEKNIWIQSGYRTYQEQSKMYFACEEKKKATGDANTCIVGYPGCSEHQSGRAVDLYILENGQAREVTPLVGVAEKFGLKNTVPRDTPHFYIQ